MARGGKKNTTTIVLVGLFAVIILYLFSIFVSGGVDGFGYADPTQQEVEDAAFTIVKLLIVGIAVAVGWAVASKFGGSGLTRRDFMTAIVLAIAVWWLWENVLANVLNAPTIDQITTGVGQKLGLLK